MNVKALAVAILSTLALSYACTNYLVTKGASVEGGNMISYNADSATLFGALYHNDAGSWANGTMVSVYDWDSGVYLGQIPQAPVTYTTNGNMNQWSLAITETTFGGREELQSQPSAKVDYGSLIYMTLQRAKNVREAIQTMGQLVATYGYYSEGESFSLADPNEVWILEMIGKGTVELGAVWVAVRVPDGMISAHANQARITTFPLNDPSNAVYSTDVISFARKMGYFPTTAPDSTFSFSDVYDPLTFTGARFCEARVWSFFNRVTSNMNNYLDYAEGYNLTNRMPLWVKPNVLISVANIIDWIGDHYENTPMDFSTDVGAGPFAEPYRWRPLTWGLNGETYFNERSAGTQQTGFTLVAQTRPSMPAPLGGVLWFSVDDADSAVHIPVYCGVTRVPSAYKVGNGNIMQFSFNSAFWVFQLVTNFAYSRYNTIHPEIDQKIQYYHNQFVNEMKTIDATALSMYSSNPSNAIEYVTEYSESTGNRLVQEWMQFFQYLFVKYLDGNVKTASTNPSYPMPSVVTPGYGTTWEQRIVTDTGDHYEIPDSVSTVLGGTKYDYSPLRKLKQLEGKL